MTKPMTLDEYDAHRALEIAEHRARNANLEAALKAAESQLISAACYWVTSEGGGLEMVESAAEKILKLRQELKR